MEASPSQLFFQCFIMLLLAYMKSNLVKYLYWGNLSLIYIFFRELLHLMTTSPSLRNHMLSLQKIFNSTNSLIYVLFKLSKKQFKNMSDATFTTSIIVCGI